MKKVKKFSLCSIFMLFTLVYFILNLVIAPFLKIVDTIVDILSIPYIIFCILALLNFIRNRYDKITIIVPLLNILFMILTLYLGVYSLYISEIEFGLWWQILISIIYIINIFLSYYTLKRY